MNTISISLVVLTTLIAAWFLVLGTSKVLAVPVMRERAAHVGFTATAYRRLGALELAAAAGLLLGLSWTWIGVAAAAGLLALLAGALAAHVRAGDRGPALMPALASAAGLVGYLALLV